MSDLNPSLKKLESASETITPKDGQDTYDESTGEYTTGEALETQDDKPSHFTERFPRDFYKYSQDFHDREDGAPGIDQDFGTNSGQPGRDVIIANEMPEGDGVSETQTDRTIREEIMDVFTRDESIDASDVTVRVQDGVVTLSGSVLELRMKRPIEDAVQSVPGVDELVNCLLVTPSKH